MVGASGLNPAWKKRESAKRRLEDLLDVSRITHDKLELRKEPVKLAQIIRSAVETSTPEVEADNHKITFSMPAEIILVDGDLARLTQGS